MKTQKQQYKTLDIRVIALANEDVITASGTTEPKFSELIPDWN